MTQLQLFFLKKLIGFFNKNFEVIKHIHFFSADVVSQYKNFKYFQKDFDGITAEWNFFLPVLKSKT